MTQQRIDAEAANRCLIGGTMTTEQIQAARRALRAINRIAAGLHARQKPPKKPALVMPWETQQWWIDDQKTH